MHHSGKDQSIDIGENVLERFAMLRRLRRKRCTNRARFVIRRDADIADCFTIIGDPIGEFVQLPAGNSAIGTSPSGGRSFIRQCRKTIR